MTPTRRRQVAVLLAVGVVAAAMAVIVAVGGIALPEFPTVAERPLPDAEGTVAFVRRDDEPCVLAVDPGEGRERVLHCERDLGPLSWTSDGDIAVERYGRGGSERLVLDPEGGGVLAREPAEAGLHHPPPDRPPGAGAGTHDGVHAVPGGRGRRAWVELVGSEGGDRRLLEVEGPDGYAFVEVSWSPDGTHLLLRDTAGRLLVAAVADGAVRELARDADLAAWGPGSGAISVLLGGDVHGEPPLAATLGAGGNPLAGISGIIGDADIAVMNLETPVGPGGEEADKAITFRADPVLLRRLAEAGVDVVTLANNHALDHGPDVLAQTADAAQAAGLAVVGAGPDEAAAWTPALLEVRGRVVAVLGMTDVVPDDSWVAGPDGWGVASALDHDRAVAAVDAAARAADHVVVTVHWGNEFRACPSVVQTELALRLVEAGAQIVAGHHPHVVQGLDTLGEEDSAVAYSLGNLAFYAATEETRDAALLRVELGREGPTRTAAVPVVLDAEGSPHLAGAEARHRIDERIRRRSPGGGTCPAAVWDGLPGRHG